MLFRAGIKVTQICGGSICRSARRVVLFWRSLTLPYAHGHILFLFL